MKKNLIIDTDFYKFTHWKQMPKGMTRLYSYGEARKGAKYPEVCFFGLDAIIQDHFMQPVTKEMIEEAEEEIFLSGGDASYFNKEAWRRVMDLGYLPIEIKAVAEGSIVPVNNVLFTIESTEEWFADTMNSLEGTLMHTWYPTTISTRIMNIKKALIPLFEKGCDDMSSLPFAVNDFGYRGATCHEAAGRGGAANLIHFRGSDNMSANRVIKDVYGKKGILQSVWATEHSVATSYGPGRGEFDYMNAQLDRCPDSMICSIVIDSYDDKNFLMNVVGSDEIKNKIIARQGRVVFRPDSGNPITSVLEKTEILASIFGFRINSKGYKVINHNVGLIQGDGMNENSIPELYSEYMKSGWSPDNLLTGSGGGLLQVDANRDTQRFAIKASSGSLNGVDFDIQKNPASDPTKASKSGMLKLHKSYNSYTTMCSSKMKKAEFDGYTDELKTVFKNGVHTKNNYDDIVKRAWS